METAMRKFNAAAKILQGLAVVAVILLLVSGSAFAATITDYCLIPPYVKTDVDPNIMLIMDNSKVMGGPIYTWGTPGAITDPNVRAFPQCTDVTDPMYSKMALRYDVARTTPYEGMFKSYLWYSYMNQRFTPDTNGVFDGNLLNFLTTSQYDLMMGILVGGKSTSRQTNVNTLVGYNAAVYGTCSDGTTTIIPWDVRVFEYIGTDNNTYVCEFTVNDANRGDLKVSDSIYYHAMSGYVCGLIATPAVRPKVGYYWLKADASDFIDMPEYAQGQSGGIHGSSIVKHIFSFINSAFELFSSPAEAAVLKVASPKDVPNPATFSTTLYQAMTPYTCTASGGTGNYTWSASGLPAGITISTAGVISGTPNAENDTTRGNISVTITVNDGSNTASSTAYFTVGGSVLTITAPTTSLTDAGKGVAYDYQCMASGGSGSYSNWSASGLPTGLSINSTTGRISGTTTAAAGTYTVGISVSDGHVTKLVTVSLKVKDTLFITAPTASMTDAQYNVSSYSYTCTASGGTGTYSWSASGLPTGLSINSSTGVVSGTPSQLGTFSVNITVTSGVVSSSVTVTLTVRGIRITWPTPNFDMGDIIYNADYAARFRAVAQGSTTGAYTWSATGLPAGFTITDNVISGTHTGQISGKCNDATWLDKCFTAIISVTDTVTSDSVSIAGCIRPATNNLINIINLSNDQTLPDAVQGQPYGGFSAGNLWGSKPNVWSIPAGSLPAGLNFTSQSGLIYGTPTGGVGCSTFTLRVDNSKSDATLIFDSRSVTLCVISPSAPAIIAPATDGSYLPDAEINQPYSYTPAATGGTPPYTWNVTGLPSSLPAGLGADATTGRISGTPTTAGEYSISLKVTDSLGLFSNRSVNLKVLSGPGITTPTTGAALPDATEGSAYTYSSAAASGGTGSYTWSASGLPSGLSINSSNGTISGIPAAGTGGANGTTYTVIITVTDSYGGVASVAVTLTVSTSTFTPNTATFNVRICAGDYNLNCNSSNADLDCDTSQTAKDNCLALGWCNPDNGNACELKAGILQTYWEQARFGLIDFDNSSVPSVDKCVPASPQSTFFTAVENALPIDNVSKLIDAEYMAVHTYMGQEGTCDPFAGDTKICRKNFILMLTNGEGAQNGAPNVFGTSPAPGTLPATCSSLSYNLSKNACYGYLTDLRDDDPVVGKNAMAGTQNVSTYVVNAMGTNGAVLEETALNAGGKYYYSANADELKSKIETALKDIIKRASAGTAASVLASGEGSGANLIQAIFYPASPTLAKGGIFSDEINWIGRLTNYWYYVDPFFGSSSIREDTPSAGISDAKLNLVNDYVATFYYDATVEQTKATLYQDTNGDGYGDTCKYGTAGSCPNASKVFEKLGNLWEAGVELWKRDPATRTVKTWVDSNSDGVVDSGEVIDFSSANKSALRPYFNLTATLDSTPGVDDADADVLIRYVRGEDFSGLRTRSTKVDLNNDGDVSDTGETTSMVWKLSDVLNSTPKIASHLQLNTYEQTNKDTTYKDYLNTSVYMNKGAVFTGGNDGMLHAFKLGKLELKDSATCTLGTTNTNDSDNGNDKACLTGTDKGKELWAFIPKNVLPYLNYLADPAYCHIFTVDQTPYVFDASIKIDTGIAQPAACSASEYWRCVKTKDSWRTILIGGMRYGGACRGKNAAACTDCVRTPGVDLNGDGDTLDAGEDAVGYSSYFALDVTVEDAPQLLWEFSGPQLGFTTGGPAIVRIDARTVPAAATASIKDEVPGSLKNGRWFVVIGSGPTGPIDTTTQQFMGHSDQNLRLFVLDLKTGQLVRTIDTGIADAFAGSLLNATHNVDAPDYQDDAIYIPYVRKCGALDALEPCTLLPTPAWNNGGVLRLLTREDLDGTDLSGTTGTTALNPGNWVLSEVIDGIGPVTSSVARLQHQTKKQLWLYFGTGRYFYEKQTETDDGDTQRNLIGMLDPCFVNGAFIAACTDSDTSNDPTRSLSDLGPVTLTVATGTTDTDGWYIALDPANSPYKAEREITDPLATTSGLVFFTTFKPYADECALGGKSHIWALKYDTGAAPGALLKGKAIVQVSTGAIEQIDLSKAFIDYTGRRSGSLEGVPPTAQGLSIISSPPPVKRILHMRER